MVEDKGNKGRFNLKLTGDYTLDLRLRHMLMGGKRFAICEKQTGDIFQNSNFRWKTECLYFFIMSYDLTQAYTFTTTWVKRTITVKRVMVVLALHLSQLG